MDEKERKGKGRKQGQEARKGRTEGRLKEAQEEKRKREARNGGKETKITGSKAEAVEMRKERKKRKEATNKEKQRSKKKQEETPYGNHKHHQTPPCRPLWPGTGNTIPGTENTHGRPTHHSGNSKPESGN